jgi:beta-lactamase superfamily II metal-dependent hydrolase
MTMFLRIFDVEHGACAMIMKENGSALAMVDCGDNITTGWSPSTYIKNNLGKTNVDYLLITNTDQDHLSDLAGLRKSGIAISNLVSNTLFPNNALRQIKLKYGPLTADMDEFINMRENFGAPGVGVVPFNQVMGGITYKIFNHSYPTFTDTNNLSCVYFISYGSFKIMFPGDLEKAGWREHLRNPQFVAELQSTTILVASHHGRDNGFSEEAFRNLKFRAVVISDKSIVHSTQETVPDYRTVVNPLGIVVTNRPQRRHVLTTRRDGDILFRVVPDGSFDVSVG